MATRFLYGDEVWREIRDLAHGSRRACVAVAYLGTGAYERMPLPEGSVLVVDASEGAVKAKQTDPRELARYRSRGVTVSRVQGLHAKVYVFGSVSIIGSPNVSRSSEEQLLEAAVRTDSRPVVEAARHFVLDLAADELDAAAIDRLTELYLEAPERHWPAAATRGKRERRLRRLWVVSTTEGDWDEATQVAYEKGLPQAEAATDLLSYEIYAVEWYGRSSLTTEIGTDQQIIEMCRSGRGVQVYPPCDVKHVQSVRWPRGSTRSKRIVIYLAREKSVEPMSWTNFDRLTRKQGISNIKRESTKEIIGDAKGKRLRAVFSGG